jgi:low affinity Fe/Cu permease
MREIFGKFATVASVATGSAWAFIIALLVIITWAITGPIFGFSDTWQLVINTGTTIVTFLMVFLIQHAQNRDSLAIQLKLDELLRAIVEARTDLVDIENSSEKDLESHRQEFRLLREKTEGDRESK